ncbi:MAG TPA: molybdopterin oxidoreductase [Thiotrichaceae bacterium]|nr:molybdopterin oxidoreductase [Thiotrichaceae bacterium]
MGSKKITYSEIENKGMGFYGLFGLLGFFLLAGGIAFFTAEHNGHHITGMNNQVVWGLPHVFAIFLVVAASGALNIASIGTVFGKKIYQPLGRLSGLMAIALLVGGLIILVLDLGRADYLIEMMKGDLNFKSVFAWNMILYGGFVTIVGFYLWTMMSRSKLAKKLYRPVGISALAWRLMLTTGTGSIFGFLVSRQAYDAAILAPLFIILSFAIGLAFFITVLMFTYKCTDRNLGNILLNKLRYLLSVFILAVLLFEATRHLANLYATEHHAVEAFMLAGGNIFSSLFWYGYVVVGTVLPLVLIFCRKLKDNRASLVIAAILTMLGGFSLLYVIIIGGQAFPLVLFPNAEVSSSYFDGVMNTYSASLWEVMLGVAGVALTLLVILVGVKVLRFLPESLADSVVDPHAK